MSESQIRPPESPPNEGERQLTRLLNELELASGEVEACECFKNDCPHEEAARVARSRLESLYREQREEIERLRGIYSVCPSCDTSWTRGEVADARPTELQVCWFAGFVASYEAEWREGEWGTETGNLKTILAKLRRISASPHPSRGIR